MKRLVVPEQRNYEYSHGLAYQLAGEELGKINLEEQCRKTEAVCQSTGANKTVLIELLNRLYLVTLPQVSVSLKDSNEEVPLRDKILILHYFIHAGGTHNSNTLISFKELPEGAVYFRTYEKRAIKPLADCFGKEPQKLIEYALTLGGKKADYGDAAVTINAFRRVPITFVVWQGDEEFPPEGNILFDSTIPDYLSTEDIIVLCQAIVWKLINSARERG